MLKTCDRVKLIISEQFEKDIVSGDFDVGFVSGSQMISVRTQADLTELWSDVRAGKKITLWCDGLKNNITGAGDKPKRSLEQNENASDEETHRSSKQPPAKKKKTEMNVYRKL